MALKMSLQGHSAHMPAQVRFHSHHTPSGCQKYAFYINGLTSADFDYQAHPIVVIHSLFRYVAVDVQAIRSAIERQHRIVIANLWAQTRNLAAWNVRWVRNDQIEGFIASIETTCRNETCAACNAEPFRISLGDFERGRADVGG